MKFSFEDFVLDTEAFNLKRNGVEVNVESRVLETLILLIRQRHRVVSKNELLETVWEVDFASEATLFKAIQQARKALADDGKAQRLIKTVHGKGYRFIGKVDENPDEDTETTPTSSEEAPPEADNVPPPGKEHARNRSLRPFVVGALLSGVLLLIVSGFLFYSRGGKRETQIDRLSVAILSCSGDPSLASDRQWMIDAVPELLVLRLRGTRGLRLVPEEDVAEALRDLKTASSDDPRVLFDRLNCDALITSRISQPEDERIQIEGSIIRADRPGRENIVKNQKDGDLFALVGELGSEMARRLGANDQAEKSWTPTVKPAAFASYVEGLKAFRAGDLNQAVMILAPLTAQNPRFIQARITLARVYQAMGLKDAAGREARSALDFEDRLPAETRLRLEALAAEIDGRWSEASRIYRSLWSVAPDELEYPLSLIRTLRWDGRSDEKRRCLGCCGEDTGET